MSSSGLIGRDPLSIQVWELDRSTGYPQLRVSFGLLPDWYMGIILIFSQCKKG